MRYVIYGAGGIGSVIGARLAQAGFAIKFIARGEHGKILQQRGLRLISPDQDVELKIPTVFHPGDIDSYENTVVLICVKSQHTQAVLQDLALCAPSSVAIACVQNGVANEAISLRYFSRVYATVVNLPAMFVHPGEVITHAQGHGGILDTGCYPDGIDRIAEQINMDFSTAGFSARADARVMRQKYAKLLSNLFNILQAGLADFDNSVAIQRILRDEALACFAAANIDCANQAETKARREGVYRMADIPGYARGGGSSWQSMARGTGDIETEYLNGEICQLGRLYGVPTPGNDVCVAMARELVRRNQGPGQITTENLMVRIDQHRTALQPVTS